MITIEVTSYMRYYIYYDMILISCQSFQLQNWKQQMFSIFT